MLWRTVLPAAERAAPARRWRPFGSAWAWAGTWTAKLPWMRPGRPATGTSVRAAPIKAAAAATAAATAPGAATATAAVAVTTAGALAGGLPACGYWLWGRTGCRWRLRRLRRLACGLGGDAHDVAHNASLHGCIEHCVSRNGKQASGVALGGLARLVPYEHADNTVSHVTWLISRAQHCP